MRISNIAILGILLPALPAPADDILLSGAGNRLTGEVRSIEPSGIVELASPLTTEPLRLTGGSVRKVTFTAAAPGRSTPEGSLELSNGDRLPVRQVRMSGDVLQVDSPDLGKIDIPRDAAHTLQVGIEGLNKVYQGPKSLREWTSGGDDPKNWLFRDGTLRAEGTARASAGLDLPRSFVLKFTLSWDNLPNVRVWFADSENSVEEARDRYLLQFNRAGMELKRESSEGRHPVPIAVLNRTPDLYPDRRLEVEIAVDRNTSRIHLFLNGEPEGTFEDPVTPVPAGGVVRFECNTSRGQTQEIHRIEVYQFDDSRRRHHSEDRGDPETDSLISRDDDRWGGRLMEIASGPGGAVFRFKSDFQEKPLELPEEEVSTIFFARKEGEKPAEEASPFVLKLRDNGSLRVKSCRFAEGRVDAEHPLLGPIRFAGGAVTEMEWVGDSERDEKEGGSE
ncbi:MAG: hypothetical protein H7A49_07920 [Akkermansiaceae bacterium]|nr:hypothetical protein [Akkermansiaceae bacterium]MCP5543820.1 hypothetical protein [Akkermansiaceae bacterium]MCP5546510.1 hypothetical protein [Akkermansiaceae bacterium]